MYIEPTWHNYTEGWSRSDHLRYGLWALKQVKDPTKCKWSIERIMSRVVTLTKQCISENNISVFSSAEAFALRRRLRGDERWSSSKTEIARFIIKTIIHHPATFSHGISQLIIDDLGNDLSVEDMLSGYMSDVLLSEENI